MGEFFTIDCMASLGTVIRSSERPQQPLPFVSRFKEPGSIWTNVTTFPFCDYYHQFLWLFPPRRLASQVFHRFLSAPVHAAGVCILLQHNEIPSYFPLLKKCCIRHLVFYGDWTLRRPQKKKETFVPYLRAPVVHAFLIPAT